MRGWGAGGRRGSPLRRGCRAGLLAALALVAPAGASPSANDFAGFEAVVVGCIHRSDLALGARLCEAARARIGLAAARAGVRLVLAPANDPHERRRRARDAGAVIMTCELAVTAARGGGADRAMHARLALVHPYRAAVEADAGAEGPGATPRAGTLELWSQDIIASGPPERLVPAMAEALERLAGSGFEVYLAGGGAPAVAD